MVTWLPEELRQAASRNPSKHTRDPEAGLITQTQFFLI